MDAETNLREGVQKLLKISINLKILGAGRDMKQVLY